MSPPRAASKEHRPGRRGKVYRAFTYIRHKRQPMRFVFWLMVSLLATRVYAADLMVSVRTGAGKPVADAVIMVYPASGAASDEPIHFAWPLKIEQKDLAFHPFVLIAPVGGTVAFPNLDRVRHNVYSFSPAHPFELKLYGADETRSVRFDKAGDIALGCNIHDSMLAFIKVVDTPYAAKTDSSGVVELHGLPAGAANLRVWHPYLKASNNEIARSIALPPAGAAHQTVAIDLRIPPDRRQAY
jgi:plastocyanin